MTNFDLPTIANDLDHEHTDSRSFRRTAPSKYFLPNEIFFTDCVKSDHCFRTRKAFLLIYSLDNFIKFSINFDPSLFERKLRMNEEMSEVYPKDDEY